ncbi:MAG TPA: HD domain-containing protein [Kineosporiaceae bacterium]
MDYPETELTSLLSFAYEMGYLKRVPRSGWFIAGVQDPESIAEHSFRVAIIAMLLAQLEGADPGKAAVLGLLHDSQESRIGDVPSVGRAYVRTASNPTVTADQTAGFPPAAAALVRALVGEYEARTSLEALCAKDADKLECALQAREYEAAGNRDVAPWVETSLAGLRTESGRRLGELCRRVEPRAWWAQAAAEYPARPRAVPD